MLKRDRKLLFVAFSSMGWLADTAVLLMAVALGCSPFFGGVLGAVTGSAFAFSTSRRWVFLDAKTAYWNNLAVYVIYAMTVALLIGWGISISSFFVKKFSDSFSAATSDEAAAIAAKILVTPLSLMFNYLVARHLLAKRKRHLN